MRNKAVSFAPGTIIEDKSLNTEVPDLIEEKFDPKDDKFENLGGHINFINMDMN